VLPIQRIEGTRSGSQAGACRIRAHARAQIRAPQTLCTRRIYFRVNKIASWPPRPAVALCESVRVEARSASGSETKACSCEQ
jgi:hypothetical protein